MAILGTNLDYTDKDFDALRPRLFNLISSVFPTWTARQVANFGNLLVEMFAFVGDVLGKYQDNQANESRWTKATQRKNLIALAKLIGFEPDTATASQVGVVISIPSTVAGDVPFDAGTVVRTQAISDPVEFRLLADVTIPAGSLSVAATAENAEPQDDVFTSTGVLDLQIVLLSTPYLDGSAVISAGNGVYSEVDSFLDSTSSDRHFTSTVDQNDKATIRFGDGVSGAIPSGTITVNYKTGGGSAGQVEAGTVTAIEGVFTDTFGTSVQPTVTNASSSTSATDRQSVEQIREEAPETLRVLNRTVAREDYEIGARRVAQVARALMLTSDEDTAIGENAGFLFIVPVGGGTPTQALLDDVEEMVTVTFPNTLTFSLTVATALYKSVNVSTTVFLSSGANAATVDAAIRSNLASFFAIQDSDGTANPDIDFGFGFLEATGDPTGALPFSDIYNVIRDTTGILKMQDGGQGLTLNGEDDDVSLLLREFPILGTVTIINGATGSPLV